jgi:L-iditol 2-dehydrogenase/galactitol-1-phosphate 5-dehydrogenase
MHAALTEPCAVALHAVRRMRVEPGMSAAVFGGGPIGTMAAQWLRFAGCRPVALVDIDAVKLAAADTMGFEAVDSTRTDPVAAVREICGEGADCVVEAVGLPVTFLQSLRCAARGGQVVFMGNIAGTFSVGEQDVSSILRRELRIYGTWNSRITPRGSDDWSTVLRMLDREIDVAPLISHTPSLEEGPEILARIAGRKEPFSRVVFRIGS